MKKLAIFFLFIIIPLIASSQSKEWERIYSSINPNTLYEDFACYDSIFCITLARTYDYSKYFFELTTNGGKSWKIVYYDTTNHTLNSFSPDIRSISFPDTSLFIAVGDSGRVYRTTDLGKTWTKTIFDSNRTLYNLKMLDKNYGIMCAGRYDDNDNGGRIYSTSDGGLSWKIMNTPKEFWGNISIDDIQIINKDLFVILLYFVSTRTSEIIWVKRNWEDYKAFPRNNQMDYLYFINDSTGWLSGGTKISQLNYTQRIEYTEDSGKNFIVQRDTMVNSYRLTHMDFFDNKHGMIATGEGLIIKTNNGGKTWLTDSLKGSQYYPVKGVQFPSITTAYAIGNGSSIYKYTRDWSVVAEEQENEGYNVSLYPNPASDKLNLSLTKDMYGEAEVSLIDIHGRTISSFKTREFTSSIDVSGLPPGVYGVITRFGNRVVGKRVSVVR